ncbi:MAG TPA: SDR family NAD(P)-dependent oxidoreductase [Thermomicrobiales bacterium]|nr:SDR family NAD(P)-dependent oxidoreductase [Thermomicrobiales bacterium]
MKSGLLKGVVGLGAAIGVHRLAKRSHPTEVRDKVVLITGSSTGLGLEMARVLADEGANLVICARNESRLERARQDLAARGADVLAIRCDVADREAVRGMIASTIDRFGRIDVLICNAGIIQVGQFESMPPQAFHDAMNIIFFGSLYPIMEAVPHMRAQGGGHIGLVTSIGGVVSVPYLLPYNAAKFASVGLGQGLRAELAPDGIVVTTLVPGLMRTGSYLNARFHGESGGQRAIYKVFSAISSLPILTAGVESAARAFVGAIRRGEAHFVYPPQYKLIALAQGVAPDLVIGAMGLADRILPETEDDAGMAHGATIDETLPSHGVWRVLTTLGRRSTQANQFR